MTELHLDRERLRRAVDELGRDLAADAGRAVVRPRVTTRLIGDQQAEAVWEQYGKTFTFASDEAVDRGGGASAPSPLRYFLAGIAFCQQVWVAKGAVLAGCDLESCEITIETVLDQRGELHVADVPRYPQSLRFDVRIASPSAGDRVLAAVDEANARCPLYAFAARAVPVTERVFHNGVLIRDTTGAA